MSDLLVAGDSHSEVLRAGGRLVVRSWRKRPLAHAAATTGAVIYALASVGFSEALGHVADTVIVPVLDDGSVARSTLWWGLFALAAVGSLRAIGAMGRRWFQSMAEYGTQRSWRTDLVTHYVDLSLPDLRRRPAGQLMAHADTDLDRSTRMLKPLAFVVGTIALAVASFVSLLAIHVLFAVVALVLFPILSLLNRVYTTRVAGPAAQEREENGRVSAIAHESFDGALVVKTLGREREEVARLSDAAHQLRQTRVTVGRLRAVFDPLIEALPGLGVVALVGIGGWLVETDRASVGDLLTAVSLFTILSVPVRIVGFMLEELPGSVAALARVDDVMAMPLPPSPATTEVLAVEEDADTTEPATVSVDNVNFQFPDGGQVLHDVSFSSAAGESIAIVGATGSGKSTLVGLLAGLAQPTSGQVLLGGSPIGALDPPERARRVATVFQETFLFASSIRENVTLGVEATDAEVIDALEGAQALEFVESFEHGINTVVGERGVTLSGGQRQRIAVARILLRRPSLVLLDDATSALDPAVERAVLDGLKARLDATVVLVAYRLATIELADRVVFLQDGKIRAEGLHSELMHRLDYAALVRAYENSGHGP